jgi:hypothetical protein
MVIRTEPGGKSPVETVLALLPDHRKAGKGWTARCPAHDDDRASLSIAVGKDGQVLLHCHAGCDFKDIVKALKLEERDLFATADGDHAGNGQDRPAKDWAALAHEYAAQLTPERKKKAAAHLGLPPAALDLLPHVGYSPKPLHKDQAGPCLTFPEVDGSGRVCGILCRYRDGSKLALAGGRRGLIVPAGWKGGLGPVLVVEGPSDTLALSAMGLCAVGRPSNCGGAEDLAVLLKGLPPGQDIIVLGDHDSKADLKFPGLEGLLKVWAELRQRLPGRAVFGAMPPNGHKDARAWFQAQSPALGGQEQLLGLGKTFLEQVEKAKQKQPPAWLGGGPKPAAGTNGHALAATPLTEASMEPVHYLVPGYLPLGKLVLLAGDGGHGKSVLTLHLAACLSRGWRCLGLEGYEPHPPCDILLISCEDDLNDTIVPRLLSAGADLRRVFHVEGVRDKDGKVLPFSLAHYEQLEAELARRPEVRLVVIDPAGAYVGKSGVVDHRDSELRSLLGPLSELAARRQVTILLVKHVVKGATAKAVHKVSGSAGYVNAVRAAFLVAPDSNDPEKKLLLPLKGNLGKKPAGLAFGMVAVPQDVCDGILADYGGHLTDEDQELLAGQLFRLQWLGQVDVDPDDLMSEQARREKPPGKVEQAAEWLQKFLAEYAYPSEEIIAAGKEAGFRRGTLFDAKKELDIKASNQGSFHGAWWWGLGDSKDWTRRPDVVPDTGPTGLSGHSGHSGLSGTL